MTTAAGITTTTVTTTQQAPLGFELTVPNGDKGNQTWVYVFNDDPTNAFAAGGIVYRDPSAATEDYFGATYTPVTTHQPKVTVIGVAQHAIATGSYGFVLQRGAGVILGPDGATIAADTPFTSGGAQVGSALQYAHDTEAILNASISVIGHTLAVIAATAAVTGDAWIDCT